MTLPGYQTYPPAAPPRPQGKAVASLVLGLVSLPALLLCGAGMFVAVVGLALGIMAAARGAGRRKATGGIVASVVTLTVGAVAIFWVLQQAAECADSAKYPDDSARQRCVEREFPFAQSKPNP